MKQGEKLVKEDSLEAIIVTKNILCPKCLGSGRRMSNANAACEARINDCAFCDGTGIVVQEMDVNLFKGKYNG